MKKILLVIVAALVSACQSYSLGRYTPSVDNQLYLRGLAPAQINVSEFTATTPDDKDILCVGRIYIRTQDDETFSKFIQNALTSELKLAGVYSPNAKTTLSGKLEHIDASYHRSQWEMTLRITSSNGKSAIFSDVYPYHKGFYDSACMLPAQAFIPAVQDLIKKIVTSQEFKGLIQN